jgi:hypothetical protein
MAKSKLPPQLVAYWEKKNKQQNDEDSKSEDGKQRIRNRKASNAVKAAVNFKKSKAAGAQSEEAKQEQKTDK